VVAGAGLRDFGEEVLVDRGDRIEALFLPGLVERDRPLAISGRVQQSGQARNSRRPDCRQDRGRFP
jgi:hypothetical protein